MSEILRQTPGRIIGKDGNSVIQDMDDILTFCTRAKGSSHLATGRPCQDYGLKFKKDGLCIAIVCDGHGGEKYVRSDKGAEIAANVAKDSIIEFVSKSPKELFQGRSGAVTSAPVNNPAKDKDGNSKSVAELTESQLELLGQINSYFKESEKNKDVEAAFRRLFCEIKDNWKAAVVKDVADNPFTEQERERIGQERIEKAYGTTLMAAVRTDDYWFAFQIGDGKILACNRLMQWKEPVPRDCRCFMNMTTSLCDVYSEREFRYAFDGTGFPLSFLLGSDGIEDTFIREDLIHKFYSQLLCVFDELGSEEAEKLLESHLADLSVKGSHDDMSVAAIIDKKYLHKSVEYYKNVSEMEKLKSEKEKLSALQRECEEYLKEIEYKRTQAERQFEEYMSWWEEVQARQEKLQCECQTVINDIEEKKNAAQAKEKECDEGLEKRKEAADDMMADMYPCESQSAVSESAESMESVDSAEESASCDVISPRADCQSGNIQESEKPQSKESL